MPSHAAAPRIVLVVCLCGLLALAGCGGPDLPPMAKVTGTVTLDGKPVPRGTIQFIPDSQKGTPKGPPAVGQLDKDGRFTLVTAGVEGAIGGWHRVRIQAQGEGSGKDLEGNFGPEPWLIPMRYNNPATSKLSFEVKADQDNDIPVELTVREQ